MLIKLKIKISFPEKMMCAGYDEGKLDACQVSAYQGSQGLLTHFSSASIVLKKPSRSILAFFLYIYGDLSINFGAYT
jgi:hypothetical protein